MAFGVSRFEAAAVAFLAGLLHDLVALGLEFRLSLKGCAATSLLGRVRCLGSSMLLGLLLVQLVHLPAPPGRVAGRRGGQLLRHKCLLLHSARSRRSPPGGEPPAGWTSVRLPLAIPGSGHAPPCLRAAGRRRGETCCAETSP